MEGGRPTVVKPDAGGSDLEDARIVSIVPSPPCWSPWRWSMPAATRWPALDAQEQMAGQCVQVRWLDHQHRFCRLRPARQPSITQVLTWFHSLLFQWEWELFLTDPFIFLFWIFIIVTVFVWGRGCSAAGPARSARCRNCSTKVGGWVGLKRFQFKVPKPWHNRLKWIKYGIFFGLLAVSMFSMGLAEKLAEVEPFKTTFLVGLFSRSWPTPLFAAGLLGLSIFTERPFCKYLCPLGPLAMPSTFRWFGLRAGRNATPARPARSAVARWRSTRMVASTIANACSAWTAWSSTPTTTPARRWYRNASVAPRTACR